MDNCCVITTYGLSDEQNRYVETCFPTKEYELYNCNNYNAEDFTDWVATKNTVFIINAQVLPESVRDMFWDYYNEVGESCDETVIWLGEPLPPKKIQKLFKCYNSFDEISHKLKYILLTAHKRSNRAVEYSRILEKGILVLSLIRNNPGITTKDIAGRTQLSVRTVQRYIEALQTAGEWIEYDLKNKGWWLHHGISILFGDNLNE